MKAKKLKIGLLQFSVNGESPAENIRRVYSLLSSCAVEKPDLILLPELWFSGFNYENLPTAASQNWNEGAFQFMSDWAQEFQTALCGSHVRQERGHFFNTEVFFTAEGELVAFYDKIHLFSPMQEDRFFTAGQRVPRPIKNGGVSFGFGICYDLRFPELFRMQALSGAQVFLISAQWPTIRVRHWRLLLQARAIENQAFVVAANRTGQTGSIQFAGASMVVSPTGKVLLEAPPKDGLFFTEIEMENLFETRTELPFLRDIRSELFFCREKNQ